MLPRFKANGHSFALMISMGICLVEPGNIEPAVCLDLIQRADSAMYAA